MSRIGKKPIIIPEGVQVTQNGLCVNVKGKKGELKFTINKDITMKIEDNKIKLLCNVAEKMSLYGTSRAILANMVHGVSQGFQKSLEIQGVGFRASLSGKKLILSLGFSHPSEYNPIDGVNISIDDKQKNIIYISGIDKEKVGEVAAQIRSLRKPEPYKGKGIRYVGEHIVRKAGKSAAAK
jgi:large subunit ribosomal protein L6